MLTLLSPVALWAMSALALPVAIHLRRRPPRTVALGSVRFLHRYPGRRLHDLRWRERWLLLIRLFIVASLVGLLTRPVWQPAPTTKAQRWILLDPTGAPAGPSLARLQALQANGYSTHLLVAGLPEIRQFTAKPEAVAPDLWSLLREVDASLPVGSNLAVFSPARLTALRGVRPALRSKLEWIETPDVAGNEPHVWIESIQPGASPAGMPLVTVGSTDGDTASFGASPPKGWKLETRSDAARLVAPTGDHTPWTEVSALAPLGIRIFHDADRTEDARYLTAGIRAAVEPSGHRLNLQTTVIDPELGAQPKTDWTFWLSANGPPDAIRNGATQLFQDATARAESSPGWIVAEASVPGASSLTPGVRFWHRGPVLDGTVVWSDEHGASLLTRQSKAHGLHWRFASRFRPDWTDLPQTTALPAWLEALMLPVAQKPPEHDRRRVAPSQAQTSDAPPPEPGLGAPLPHGNERDLRWSIWTLAALLLVLERLLCHRSVNPVNSPVPPSGLAAVR